VTIECPHVITTCSLDDAIINFLKWQQYLILSHQVSIKSLSIWSLWQVSLKSVQQFWRFWYKFCSGSCFADTINIQSLDRRENRRTGHLEYSVRSNIVKWKFPNLKISFSGSLSSCSFQRLG